MKKEIIGMKTEEAALMAAIGIFVIAAFAMFGITGAKAITAFLIFALPFYLILNNFKLEKDEKIFFALFFGLAYFAMAVWIINRILPSLKLSIIAAFIAVCLIGLFWKKLKMPTGE